LPGVAGGSGEPPLPPNLFSLSRLRRLEMKNRFAFFHQVEAIAGDCFQIRHVGLEQTHFAGLTGEQKLLLVYLRLQIIDLAPALHKPFVGWNEQTDDAEPDGHDEQDTEDAVKSLPNCSFVPLAEISVTLIHFSAA
jgi:hypothetical protein